MKTILVAAILLSALNPACFLVKEDSSDHDTAAAYPEFGHETEVLIDGYNSDAMEPFITRDGRFLFFNSLNDGKETSLFYAEKIDDTRFVFLGEIRGVNGPPPHLDAVASMDDRGEFFFVSTRGYPAIFENLQAGLFDGGEVTGVHALAGDFYVRSPGWIVMDAEISADGGSLYYANARFAGRAVPEQSVLGVAEKRGAAFRKMENSERILARVNAEKWLVYAPSTSADGRELYFTRMERGKAKTEICVSVRPDPAGEFGAPMAIGIAGEGSEAPTLTGDGTRIYYHRKTGADGRYRLFSMKRK